MKKRFKSVERIVEEVLTDDVESRNDDQYLYAIVIQRCNAMVAGLNVIDYLKGYKNYNTPPFETVSRVRRKIQAKYPNLSGDDLVEAGRIIAEMEYRDYAKQI